MSLVTRCGSPTVLHGGHFFSVLLVALSGCALTSTLPELPTAENLARKEKQTISLAQLAEQRGQDTDAKHIYEELIKKNPKHQLAHHRLGVMAAKNGKYAEADEHFFQAYEIGPKSPQLLSDMGYRLFIENRLPEAEKMYREALAIEPKHPTANNNLGLVLGQQGRSDEALQCFLRVNSEAQAHCSLGYVLTQIARIDEAKFHFNQSLSHDPNLRAAANGLLYLTGNYQPRQPVAPSNPLLPPQQVAATLPPAQPMQAGWNQLPVTENKVPVNPQPPAGTLSWNGPQAAVPQSPPATTQTGGVQPVAYNSAMPAYHHGTAPSVGSTTAPYSGPMGAPMQFSNGIPQGATPYGTSQVAPSVMAPAPAANPYSGS